jgi:hypothetical protein
MIINLIGNSDIPSKQQDLLHSLNGLVITKLSRFSWIPGSQAVEDYQIQHSQVFSLTAGPLIVHFDSDLVIGFSSNPSIGSIILWVEKNEIGEVKQELTEFNNDLFNIDANDIKYSCSFWASLIGQKISSTKILKRKPQNSLYEELPNEVGLVITTESEDHFIASHGLHDNSDDFSIIEKSQIDVKIIEEIFSE